MRAQVMAVKHHSYVQAERALGASTRRVLFRHALPNALPPLLIMMAFTMAAGMAAESGLTFVGLGAQPPTPSWGLMFDEGLGLVQTTPWPLIAPLIALGLATTAFTLFGETLQDVMDPKRRQRRG
jgi:ABC-type dipeptide/oligopeptide/nickel transport system permease subunit